MTGIVWVVCHAREECRTCWGGTISWRPKGRCPHGAPALDVGRRASYSLKGVCKRPEGGAAPT